MNHHTMYRHLHQNIRQHNPYLHFHHRKRHMHRIQLSRHKYLLQTYRAQDWEKAKNFLSECRNLDKEERLGKLYDLYEERIAEFEAHPPGPDWDGVYVATSK